MSLHDTKNEIAWTGERFLPSISGRIRYEHFHRYAICLDHVKDKDVLDIACGEGYGSAILSGSAASVIGVDLNDVAVMHAKQKYAEIDNLSFYQGSVDRYLKSKEFVQLINELKQNRPVE